MKLNKRKTLRPRAPKSSMATTKAAGSSLSWRSLKPNGPPAKKTWATQTHIGSQHLVDTPNPLASRVTASCAQLWHSCFQMIIFLWSHQHCHHFGQAGQSSSPFCWASTSALAFFFASRRALASFTSFRSRSCMIRSVSR